MDETKAGAIQTLLRIAESWFTGEKTREAIRVAIEAIRSQNPVQYVLDPACKNHPYRNVYIREPQCRHVTWRKYDFATVKPGFHDRCEAHADPRCKGYNCTKHCRELCNGSCFEIARIEAQKSLIEAQRSPPTPAQPEQATDRMKQIELD